MSRKAIHILFSQNGPSEIFFEADSDKETDWLRKWVKQNFMGVWSPDPCGGDPLHSSGVPFLAGGEKENGKPPA